MTSPNIIQSAFARGSTSPITVTLGAAPTAGSILLLVIAGWSSTLTPPAGFISFEADAGSSASNQGTWVYYKPVYAGDPTSYAVTGATDYHNCALFELDSFSITSVVAEGACTGTGTTTITTGSLTAAAAPANTLRLLVSEWDNASAATTPAGWTLLSPATWQGTTTGNHDAAIWQIAPSTSGAQSITMSAATNAPIWLDLQLVPGVAAMRITQVGAETWITSTVLPPMRVTQVGAEVWLNIAQPFTPPTGGTPPQVMIMA